MGLMDDLGCVWKFKRGGFEKNERENERKEWF